MHFRLTNFRGISALAAAVGTVVVSVVVATWLDAGVITKALILLVVSIAGFHAAAWYAFERKRVWLILDYTLEAVTIVSLFAAVAGIQQSAVSEILQGEFTRRKAEQAQLVYVTKSTITNDCHPKESRKDMWTPSPEPYSGACDRMEHFLPQVEYTFGQETGIETMTADDSWARDFIINDEAAKGSWRGLYDEAKRFIEGSRRTKNVLDSQGRLTSKAVATLAGSGKLQYWQFLLALVLGLRVARRSAGLLDACAKERKDAADDVTAQPSGSYLDESLEITLTYQPAWSFAKAAANWAEQAKNLPGHFHIGEPARLALIYTALSLEAFVDEQLVLRVPEPQYAPLYVSNISSIERWKRAAALVAATGPDSQAALELLKDECKDTGNYGLLVRSRNKIVHPRVHVEVFDETGHAIKSGKLETLIGDLRKLPWYPAGIKPAFPHAVECLASANWSLATLESLVQLWFRVVGEALPEAWKKVREVDT